MSQFGINFIHVINFSNVQKVLCIFVMYVTRKSKDLCIEVGAGKVLALGALKSINYPLYTALVIGLTRERFVPLGLPS